MDILSYSSASTAAKQEKELRVKYLGKNILENHSSVKDRLDELESLLKVVSKEADRLIIQNAINLIKANLKLNLVALSKRYKMSQMIIDDFLDLSGVNTSESQNYIHSSASGKISSNSNNAIVTTATELLGDSPEKVLLSYEGSISQALVSFDNGENWTTIQRDKVETIVNRKRGDQIKLQFRLGNGDELIAYGVSWIYES